jgi:hypothetical protein
MLLSILTAILSAFLDNVTTILLVGPVTIKLCKVRREREGEGRREKEEERREKGEGRRRSLHLVIPPAETVGLYLHCNRELLISSAGSGLLLSGDGNISVSGGYFVHDDKGEGRRKRREKGEGRREKEEKGEGRREKEEKGEGRREKGEGRREKEEKGEGRREKTLLNTCRSWTSLQKFC